MNELSSEEEKLTAQGYIPPKMVAELYELGSHSWSTDWYKQKSEPICMKTTMWVILDDCIPYGFCITMAWIGATRDSMLMSIARLSQC